MKDNLDYYSLVRRDVLELFPKYANRVLDVGCGTGATGRWLKDNERCKWIAGVEVSPKAAGVAKKNFDVVFEGNAEEVALDISPETIDVIICADVLEHLLNPWDYLSKMKPLLKDDGIIIASIPNVRHWTVSLALVFKGRWNYVDAGILDRTHLRFFVKDTIHTLFKDAGFKIKIFKSKLGLKSKIVNVITLGLLKNLLTYQYLVVACKLDEKSDFGR